MQGEYGAADGTWKRWRQVVSERRMARPVGAPNTHSRARGNRSTPVWCQWVTRWPICFASLLGRTPGCWCPQITGPVLRALLGGRATATASPAEDQMLISHRSCHPRLVARPPRFICREVCPFADHGTKAGPPGSRRVLKADPFDCRSALEPDFGLSSVPERI